MQQPAFVLFVFVSFFFACKSGKNLFGTKRLHEQYAEKLKSAGLHETALGRQWLSEAERALNTPQTITLPYREIGYFPAADPRATGLEFSAKRGEKLVFQLEKNPADSFVLFAELWRVKPNAQPSFIKAADSTENTFEQEVNENGETYVLRLQPELLKSGDYTLSISVGPSLAYPVPGGRVGSVWGDPRDAGARRHEGIDIFAPKRTPAVAAADGVITSVREGGIGGKTIFMRPSGKAYSLYYAHLDEQLVSQGQHVITGDTIGFVGNTGNAATTSPHLHFGIYATGGAVDPLPFVNPNIRKPAEVNVDRRRLQDTLRSTATIKAKDKSYSSNIVLFPVAALTKSYRVRLPDGTLTEVSTAALQPVKAALRQAKTRKDSFLLESPQEGSPRKTAVREATAVKVLGAFGNYVFVETGAIKGWLPSSLL